MWNPLMIQYFLENNMFKWEVYQLNVKFIGSLALVTVKYNMLSYNK